MLDQSTRIAVLKLHERGVGTRTIAKQLKVSREAVREVIRAGRAEVPKLEKAELGAPLHEQILELFARCKGHLGRVHEELVNSGAKLSYQALTAYCRRHEIGHTPQPPQGHYDFAPGKEMQHDTSPHRARIAGVLTKVQTASEVFCFSRSLFFQMYPQFTRFECKVFLEEANAYFDGACDICMIDNTHVIVASGTGKDMVPAPEMAAFAERYGCHFEAHEKGDANRSARVEGHFLVIENNFLNGREFRDFEHLNAEAKGWCDKFNAARSNKLGASRRELFALERTCLKPRPLWVPPIYRLHHRFVDAEGFVNLHRNRYSAPWQLIGRCLEVRELKDRVQLYDGPRQIAEHTKVFVPRDERVVIPAHRPPRGQGRRKEGPPPEEAELLRIEPRLTSYVRDLRAQANGRGTLPLRRLLAMLRDYPREPFLAAVALAEQYRLFDLGRLERMTLKQIAHDYFILPVERHEREDNDE
jgi:transposase